MKKKILSVVLASALFVGGAVAASAQVWGDWDLSDRSGATDDITALEFDADSYTIRSGDALNLSEKLTAYVGDKAIVQQPDLEWDIDDNDLVFGLDVNDDGIATAYAYEGKGSTVVTVTNGEKKATCTLVAAPMIKATGYRFAESSYKFKTAASKSELKDDDYYVQESVKLVPTPAGAYFSKGQIEFLKKLTINLNTTKEVKTSLVGSELTKDYTIASASQDGDANKEGVQYKFAKNAFADVRSDLTNLELVVVSSNRSLAESIKFPNYDGDKAADIKRTAKASTTILVPAERAGRAGSITIEVGQVAKLGDFVKYSPGNTNTYKGLSGNWTLEYYNDAASAYDYAVLNAGQDKVMGVAEGKLVAVNFFGDKEIRIPINVVAKGENSKPADTTPATETGTLPIGGTMWVDVPNGTANAENTKWTVDNDNVTILPEVGAGCKVFAKKAGTATVTGTVDGKVVKTVTITIEAAGAATPDVPAETNPSTGDSLLAFLF